jgi:hypothetical protein
MAKPRELYNGPAPQAMSLMGAGIADAYANVGRIHGEGYKAMGAGIAQGITAAASAYAGYKQQQSQAKSYEGFLKNPLGQKMLGIDAGTADSYIAAAKSMGGAAEQNQFYQMGIPTMMQNTSAMEKMKAEFGFNQQLQGARLGNETALQNARIDAAYNQAWTDAQAKATYGTGAGAALPGFNPNLFSGVGATPQATQGGVMPMPMQTQRPAYNPFNKKRSLTIGGS